MYNNLDNEKEIIEKKRTTKEKRKGVITWTMMRKNS